MFTRGALFHEGIPQFSGKLGTGGGGGGGGGGGPNLPQNWGRGSPDFQKIGDGGVPNFT